MTSPADGVVRVASCRLEIDDRPWSFADRHNADIDTHWQRRLAEAPSMFNGDIHLMHAADLSPGAFHGRFLRTDFKSYLYWRDTGFPETGVLDGFGSALIRSAEGHVLLGRQRAGNINAGLAYLPGGFIDPRDVSPDGTIDIEASIRRELAEETGLAAADVEVRPGYIVTTSGPLRSFAREFVSPLTAEALRAGILAHLADDPQSELTDMVVVRSIGDLDRLDVAPYARVLLRWLLA